MKRRGVALVAAFVLLTAIPATGEGAAFPGCAEQPDHPGGDWRHYGNSQDNARNQPAETTISPDNVRDLTAAWSWSPTSDSLGGLYATAVVYAGCAFFTANDGYVVVRNADTGALVWRNDNALQGNHASLIGGVITGSPAVSDDFWIYVGVLRTNRPYVAAFRPTDGGQWELAWTTTVDETPNSMIVSGPVFYTAPPAEPDGEPRELVFQGFMGAESTATPRGGYAFLDAKTGDIVAKGYTIDDASYAAGFRGASIWGTAALDVDTLQLYAPTGNPATKNREHPHANSVVRIDGDPDSATFGEIVGHYKGNPDNYVEQVDLYNNPVCQTAGNIGAVWGQLCLQMDLDFGAAPNVFVDDNGRKLVGALQKSGVYHAFDAETMERAWTAVVGGPGIPLNSGSTAFDGERVYVNAQPPGQLWGLTQETGTPAWVQPMADVINYMAVSTANGVVYMMDTAGNLRMYDAELGLPLAVRPLSQDLGRPVAAGSTSAGIAIARNTVYVSVNDVVVAYRLQ